MIKLCDLFGMNIDWTMFDKIDILVNGNISLKDVKFFDIFTYDKELWGAKVISFSSRNISVQCDATKVLLTV